MTSWACRAGWIAVLLMTGCNHFTEGGVTLLVVSVATSGADFPLDRYVLSVDDVPREQVRINGRAIIIGLSEGRHSIGLHGAPDNCAVGGTNPLRTTITNEDTVRVFFAVSCVATTGGVEVWNSSSGLDIDPDGYLIQVNGGGSWELTPNGSTTITRLRAGSHAVALTAVAANCSIGGPNPRAVGVSAGQTVPVTFVVSCVGTTGNVEITAATSGGDVDLDGYTVQVDDGPALLLPTNGTLTVAEVKTGDHNVRLSGVDDNCSWAGQNPHTVLVSAGSMTRDTARTRFEVSCVAISGTMVVSAASAGSDLDPNGYTVRVDERRYEAVPANGTAMLPRVIAGDHTVSVDGVASNCVVLGQNSRTVRVAVADTARTTFEVRCVATQKIAFTANDTTIAVVYSDGSNGFTLAQGGGPAWSPDGTRIAFAKLTCDDYYGCYPSGLIVINADGTGIARLTDGPDGAPAWSPDGLKIAFVSWRTGTPQLHLINNNGSGIIRVTSALQVAGDPDWSPNGALIAVDCRVAGNNDDICTVTPDGNGVVRLTTDPAADYGPAWKPDDSRIAFTTDRFGTPEVVVMNADGSGLTRVLPGIAASNPAWSSDGTMIAFAELTCDDHKFCYSSGLFVIKADGTGRKRLTTGRDYAPAWRP